MAGKAYKGSSSNMVGSEGFLTLTIKMRVRPEPGCEEELVDLLKTETRSTSREDSQEEGHIAF
jgi:hypothetical protein